MRMWDPAYSKFNEWRRLTTNDLRVIRTRHATGTPIRSLARKHKVAPAVIWDVLFGKRRSRVRGGFWL